MILLNLHFKKIEEENTEILSNPYLPNNVDVRRAVLQYLINSEETYITICDRILKEFSSDVDFIIKFKKYRKNFEEHKKAQKLLIYPKMEYNPMINYGTSFYISNIIVETKLITYEIRDLHYLIDSYCHYNRYHNETACEPNNLEALFRIP